MILADKIIYLRKKNGLSQEDLANKLNVTRQAVSKWEGAQAIPDLEKILAISNLFGVTTDYLLKDEEEIEKFVNENSNLKKVTTSDADKYLLITKKQSIINSLGVFLCIISPILLCVLSIIVPANIINMDNKLASGLGIGVLLLFITIGIVLFIISDNMVRKFKYLDSDDFILEYGLKDILEERKEKFHKKYFVSKLTGVILFVLAAIVMVIGSVVGSSLWVSITLSIMLLMVAVGVSVFVYASIIYNSFNRILKLGDFTNEMKGLTKSTLPFISGLWLNATGFYLFISFLIDDWHITWIIFVVAAFFTLIKLIAQQIYKKRN